MGASGPQMANPLPMTRLKLLVTLKDVSQVNLIFSSQIANLIPPSNEPSHSTVHQNDEPIGNHPGESDK